MGNGQASVEISQTPPQNSPQLGRTIDPRSPMSGRTPIDTPETPQHDSREDPKSPPTPVLLDDKENDTDIAKKPNKKIVKNPKQFVKRQIAFNEQNPNERGEC